jgi:hypothetical protein
MYRFRRRISELACRLFSSAVAEKLATLLTVEYLQERAKRGARKKFEAVLPRCRKRPEAVDQLINKRYSRKARRTAAKRSTKADRTK